MLYQWLEKLSWKEVVSILLDKGIDLVAIIFLGYLTIRIVDFLLDKLFDRTDFDRAIEQFVHSLTIWLLWVIFLLLILSYLGMDIGPILASLSIVGFITGFALKDVLSNLAAGLLILTTKPFRIGDLIRSGDIYGVIEKIGIASCQLKTLDNLKITAPNAVLWGHAIIDYTEYDTRRFSIILSISYSSKLDKALKIVEDIVSREKEIQKTPKPELLVSKLGENHVEIISSCWVKRKDMDRIQSILNKKIKEEYYRKGIKLSNDPLDVKIIK